MIFADSRYGRQDKRSKLPKWILQFMNDSYINLSTDTAIAHVKSFLRLMGQPIDQEALQSVLLTADEVNQMNPPTQTIGLIGQRQQPGEGGAMISTNVSNNNVSVVVLS